MSCFERSCICHYIYFTFGNLSFYYLLVTCSLLFLVVYFPIMPDMFYSHPSQLIKLIRRLLSYSLSYRMGSRTDSHTTWLPVTLNQELRLQMMSSSRFYFRWLDRMLLLVAMIDLIALKRNYTKKSQSVSQPSLPLYADLFPLVSRGLGVPRKFHPVFLSKRSRWHLLLLLLNFQYAPGPSCSIGSKYSQSGTGAVYLIYSNDC